MLLGSTAPHLSSSDINRTMCLRLHAWLLRKQDCCPDNTACLNIKTQHEATLKGRWKGGMWLLQVFHLEILPDTFLPKWQPCNSNYSLFSLESFFFLTWEVFIDLIHLQDHIIGNTSLSQEDVQLARHATGHWVDTKPVGDGCKNITAHQHSPINGALLLWCHKYKLLQIIDVLMCK